MDAHEDLGTDRDGRVEERVERIADRALGGVFDRHDAQVDVAADDLLEHVGDRGEAVVLDARAELATGREVCVGTGSAEVTDT